ncbi:MAG TPA: hypothetical protein VFT29_06230 [Gemmatimonadaceae bacterium]|nr:hypothetical protein [Gemmatimonadaceae bacterium]
MRLLLRVKQFASVAVLVCASACDARTSAFGDVAARLPDGEPVPASPRHFVRIPTISCVNRVADTVRLSILRGVTPLPAGAESRAPAPTAWLPKRVTRAAATSTGFAVLDEGAKELNIFSRDFSQRVRTRGDSLNGSGTLGHPVAMAVDHSGDTIWVLDALPTRLVGFDRSGAQVRTVAIPTSGRQLALDREGNFYVGRAIVVYRVRGDTTGREGIAVAVYDRDGKAKQPLVKFTAADLVPPRINTPGVIELLLAAKENFVAVAYPASGVVDLFDVRGIGKRPARLHTTARMCLPPGVIAAYKQQMDESTEATRDWAWVPFITDVFVHENGELSVISNVVDRKGSYHLDRYSDRGDSSESVIIAKGGYRLPFPSFFVENDTNFIGIESDGGVVALRLERVH